MDVTVCIKHINSDELIKKTWKAEDKIVVAFEQTSKDRGEIKIINVITSGIKLKEYFLSISNDTLQKASIILPGDIEVCTMEPTDELLLSAEYAIRPIDQAEDGFEEIIRFRLR